MGLFSFFKKEANYEEILSGLEQDIRQAEKQRGRAGERMEWCAHNWLFYTGLGWAAYVLGFIVHVWPERHRGQSSGWFLGHAAAVTVAVPAVMYYGNVAIRALWQRAIRKHDTRIARLRGELNERLDELKKKTAFDSTKNLIDRFSAAEAAPPAAGDGVAARLRGQETKNRRRTMPNFGAPGPRAAGVPSAPSLTAKPQQQQQRRMVSLGGQGAGLSAGVQNQSAGGHGNAAHPPPAAGVVKVAPRTATMAGPGGQRPWLDKLVDQLVGDVGSSQDKYALICRHCYAHNGLVLEEEIRHIQYSCPKCGKFNPSQAAQRAAVPAASEPGSSSNASVLPGPDSDSDGDGGSDQFFVVDSDSQETRSDKDQAESDSELTPVSAPTTQDSTQTTQAKVAADEAAEQPARVPDASSSKPEQPSPQRKRKSAGKARRG
ncbi:hypothetical protein H4R19_000860 [Coemansia spiralis]|nr:hypothetical protein H4R19_000860 [Coemansia spiralis]